MRSNLAVLLLFSVLVSCAPKYENTNSSELDYLEGLKTGKYQNVDIYKSNYKESFYDGVSWKKRDKNFDNKITNITKEELIQLRWWQNNGILIIFFSDNVYKYGGFFENVDQQGHYEINNNEIRLEPPLEIKNEDENIVIVDKLTFKSINFLSSTKSLCSDDNSIHFSPQGSASPKDNESVHIGNIIATKKTQEFKSIKNMYDLFDNSFSKKIKIPEADIEIPTVIGHAFYEKESKKYWYVSLDFTDINNPMPDGGGPIVLGWTLEENLEK